MLSARVGQCWTTLTSQARAVWSANCKQTIVEYEPMQVVNSTGDSLACSGWSPVSVFYLKNHIGSHWRLCLLAFGRFLAYFVYSLSFCLTKISV